MLPGGAWMFSPPRSGATAGAWPSVPRESLYRRFGRRCFEAGGRGRFPEGGEGSFFPVAATEVAGGCACRVSMSVLWVRGLGRTAAASVEVDGEGSLCVATRAPWARAGGAVFVRACSDAARAGPDERSGRCDDVAGCAAFARECFD